MAKIAFFELEGWENELIKAAFPGHDIVLSKEKIIAESLPENRDAEVLCVFVDSHIDAQVLAAFPALKCVATRSTGYDHLDLVALKERGVTPLFVPGYGDNTVAEFAFGLMLSLTRKLYLAIDRIKESGSFSLEGLRGTDLKGKTLAVIGTGRIGKEVVRIAKGFGMNVVAYDMRPDETFANEIGFRYLSLDEALSTADIVTVHCPYNPETHHLINAGNIKKMKRGSYLINTARGPIVETAALLEALENGTLAGAGLDVLEEEGEIKDEVHFLAKGHPKEGELKTLLQNHALIRRPNVLITPHNAFNSQEALMRILNTTTENINDFLLGTPKNIAQ